MILWSSSCSSRLSLPTPLPFPVCRLLIAGQVCPYRFVICISCSVELEHSVPLLPSPAFPIPTLTLLWLCSVPHFLLLDSAGCFQFPPFPPHVLQPLQLLTQSCAVPPQRFLLLSLWGVPFPPAPISCGAQRGHCRSGGCSLFPLQGFCSLGKGGCWHCCWKGRNLVLFRTFKANPASGALFGCQGRQGRAWTQTGARWMLFHIPRDGMDFQ